MTQDLSTPTMVRSAETARETVVVTGGSTSDCVRATAVNSLSHGYRTIVPIEYVADKHESYYFADLTDLALKYADVMPVSEVHDWFDAFDANAP
jgi:maleamate amidohydrolase